LNESLPKKKKQRTKSWNSLLFIIAIEIIVIEMS